MKELENNGKNNHYSEQTGHALRGEHKKVSDQLNGEMPELISGFGSLDVSKTWLVRRSMRRISKTGKK